MRELRRRALLLQRPRARVCSCVRARVLVCVCVLVCECVCVLVCVTACSAFEPLGETSQSATIVTVLLALPPARLPFAEWL